MIVQFQLFGVRHRFEADINGVEQLVGVERYPVDVHFMCVQPVVIQQGFDQAEQVIG